MLWLGLEKRLFDVSWHAYNELAVSQLGTSTFAGISIIIRETNTPWLVVLTTHSCPQVWLRNLCFRLQELLLQIWPLHTSSPRTGERGTH